MFSYKPVALAALLLGTSAFAQTYTAKQVKFTDLGPFTQQQLEAVSGYHPGSPATADALTAAAQKLSDTGYFDDIGATIDGKSVNDLVAVFTLKPKPAANFLPVDFSNIVWMSRAEINAALKAKLPLYNGTILESTTMEDPIAETLEEALAAKGVTAKVTYRTVEPTLYHPVLYIGFSVSRPRPVVTNVKLTGVSTDLMPLVQKSVNATAKTEYAEGLGGVLTSERILNPLLDAGYINATLHDISLEPGVSGAQTPVVISATLAAGESYKVSALNFAGTPLLSAADFAATAKLHPGDVASRAALMDTLKPLDAAYRRQGYMDVAIKAEAKTDEATHQVAYTISVAPGEQYHVHEVTPTGLDPAALADFQRLFGMKTGDLYSPLYVAEFLKNNTIARSLSAYYGGFKATAYPDSHTVDLLIDFYPNPSTNVNVH